MTNTLYNLKVIVLAAGKSQRFQSVKLLAPISNQEKSTPLIQHVLTQITASLASLNINKQNLYVATGNHHHQISPLIDAQLSVLFCENAHLGLGHTIAQSVSAIMANEIYSNESDTKEKKAASVNTITNEQVSHIMITLADQVALTTEDYLQLIKRSMTKPDNLICAATGGEIMPPAIFPKKYFTALLQLTGDKGAKALLHKNKEHLEEVQLTNAAIDIDTKDDLINWHNTNA